MMQQHQGNLQLQLQAHLHPDGGFARASFAEEYIRSLCSALGQQRASTTCACLMCNVLPEGRKP